MNHQENKEFVEYYIENVINDIKPTILTLKDETIEEKKLYFYEIYGGDYFQYGSCHQEIPLDSPRPEYKLVPNDAFILPQRSETLHMLDELHPNRTAYHARHNACRDLLLCGFLRSQPEPKLPGQDDVPEDQAKRPDLVVEWNGLRNLNPRRVFIDVAVSNSAARTFRTNHVGHQDNLLWTFFGAAISRENQKRDKYAGWNLGESFVPLLSTPQVG